MNLEKVLMNYPVLTILLVSVFTMVTFSMVSYITSKENIVTMWKMEVVGLREEIQSGKVTDIHLFLEDEFGKPITNAKVSIVFDMPDMVHLIEKKMHHIENGLYATEVVFSMGGTWIGMVEARRGKDVYKNQFIIQATGPLISKEKRERTDKFHLEQPLPDSLTKMLLP